MVASLSSADSSLRVLGSALQGYGVAVATTADNIANAGTGGYSAKRTQFVSTAPGARAIVEPTALPVDITTQLVDLTVAASSYQAAAKAFASIARTENQALNTFA